MANVIIVVVLFVVVGSASFYIIKEKKKGNKCIGCPAGGCSSCKGCMAAFNDADLRKID